MTSEARIKEIVEFSILNGVSKALDAYSITEESLNRLKRAYRKKFGDSSNLIARVRDKFSDEQLEYMLTLRDGQKSMTAPYSFDGAELTILAITDTHYGSLYSNPERTMAIFEEATKRNCDIMVHIGDITEGAMNRPNSMYETTHVGYKEQRDHSVALLSQWTKPMYLLGGNHDDSYNNKLGAGLSIVEDICNKIPNATFLGDGTGTLELKEHGVKIGMFHGNDAGSSYALSYRLQRIINNMSPAQKPHVLLTGHDHKAFSMFYRNVHSVACGCVQKQSSWMTLKGIQAMEGFYIIKLGLGDGEVKWMEPRFYPFYK